MGEVISDLPHEMRVDNAAVVDIAGDVDIVVELAGVGRGGVVDCLNSSHDDLD